MSLRFNHLNDIHNLVLEEPCPKCGVLIQKNGGCKHMVCGKCKNEFCWLCLGPYYNYVHSGDFLACPLRYGILIFIIVLLFFFYNFKVIYHNENLFYIQWTIFYN